MVTSYASLALAHRKKLLSLLTESRSSFCLPTGGLLYLRGGTTHLRQWTDVEEPFRQESFFFYLTGVEVPDCHLFIDLSSRRSILVIPDFSSDHTLWCGKPPSVTEMRDSYLMDGCISAAELPTRLSSISQKILYVMEENQVKTGLNTEWLKDFTVTQSPAFKQALIECRVFKSQEEIEIMKRAAKVTGDAHKSLMVAVGQGRVQSERQGQALFQYECFKEGGLFQAYTPIVAASKAASVLHYIKNDASFPEKSSNHLLLVDAGCEMSCYASDVTRTYPISGKFQGDLKIVYEIVLDCQMAVLEALKPGVLWEDMHRLAVRVILDGLLKAKIVQGDVDTLLKTHIPALFFPHGLGHLIGIDVHDVGGYPPGVSRIDEPGIKYLRMRRRLEPGMVVTVEPGVYFVDAILDPAIQDPSVNKFLNIPILNRFRDVGGVRIEDDVLITETGSENLTGWIPKSVADIESIMAKGAI